VSVSAPDFEAVFKTHERFLWGLGYRLTGSAADADDLVQETFVRALEHPPARTDEPWRPWLLRVVINLGRDLLRRRRRRGYVGAWLPSPVETGDEESPPAYEPTVDGRITTEGRYDMLESVSFAFLLALEALTPQQRAVLLLRDVFDYSVRETGEALGMSEANIKTTHHRARRAMQAYDRERCVPTRALQEQTRHALEQFVTRLISQDVAGIETLLADAVRSLSDGGGEFLSGRLPIVGRDKVLRLYTKLIERRAASLRFVEVRLLNGLPAVVTEFAEGRPREALRTVIRCEVGKDGRIRELHTVLASRKLTAVRFESSSKRALPGNLQS
jgi:RNA polymerase sigma-70 factor (ECF subfamily)